MPARFAACRSPCRTRARRGICGDRLGDDLRHAVDEVEPREVEQRIVEQRLFRHDAHDAHVAHLSELFICPQTGLYAAVGDLYQADISRIPYRRVDGNDGAAGVRVAQKFVHVADFFRRYRLPQRAVHEAAGAFLQQRAAYGAEAVADGEVAADAEDDGLPLRLQKFIEGENQPRRRHFIAEVERVLHFRSCRK